MREPYSALLNRLEDEVQAVLDKGPQCHGWDHTRRVWRNARHLASVERADDAVVEYAALLHDIGRADEECVRGQSCHAEIGSARAPECLRRIGVSDNAFIQHVAECIRTHRYRRRPAQTPETLEARIVYDADKLDSIGAIGITRAAHFAGRIGARVHNTEPEALSADSYSTDDTAYREFLVKLRHVSGRLLTDEGRRLAMERHRFMVAFFDRLNGEVNPNVQR